MALSTKVCDNNTPPNFTGHWREWHRGHGCPQDPERSSLKESARTEALMQQNAVLDAVVITRVRVAPLMLAERTYVPFVVTSKCPYCSAPGYCDLSGYSYLCNPVIGKPLLLGMAHVLADGVTAHEWTVRVVLDFTLTPAEETAVATAVSLEKAVPALRSRTALVTPESAAKDLDTLVFPAMESKFLEPVNEDTPVGTDVICLFWEKLAQAKTTGVPQRLRDGTLTVAVGSYGVLNGTCVYCLPGKA